MDPTFQALALAIPAKVVFTLLLIAGVAKFQNLENFSFTLAALPHVPHGLKPTLTWLVPAYEIVVALTGLAGFTCVGIGLAIPLSLSFIVIAAIAHRRSLKIPCACFGTGDSSLGPVTIRNNLLMITALAMSAFSAFQLPSELNTISSLPVLTFVFALCGARSVRKFEHAYFRIAY